MEQTTFFLKSGKRFKVSSKEALDIHPKLPVATYTVGFNCCSNEFFLEKIDSFEINGKLYGNTNRYAERILNTFNQRNEVSTGVLLTGEKGSGKTLLAKRISVLAAAQGIPTIVINNPWCGEDFNRFLQMIEQPIVVLFDEFEKVYDKNDDDDDDDDDSEPQQKLLTLLDGVYPSKKLFLFTCNDQWKLDTNLRNRPGRIYYSLDFSGLDKTFIEEYCEDNLHAKEHIPEVCSIATLFRSFNFDILKAMVEEMNRYGETPTEVLQYLNARPQFDEPSRFKCRLASKDGKVIPTDTWRGNPLKDDLRIMNWEDGGFVHFTGQDLQKMNGTTASYHFVNKEGYELSLKAITQGSMVNVSCFESMMIGSGNSTTTEATATSSEDKLTHELTDY